MPKLFIISGCNGAGKTTASYTILPNMLNCGNFVNADEIARGLSPFDPEKAAIQAGRIMLARVEELLKEGQDFAIETTLATRSYVNLIKKAQSQGYVVTLLYFWPALFLAQHAFPGHRTGQTEGSVGRSQRKRGKYPPPV